MILKDLLTPFFPYYFFLLLSFLLSFSQFPHTGQTKIIRLEFIGDYCPPLRVDAYKLALVELQATLNTEKYLALAKKLNEHLASVGQPTVQPDLDWVGKTNRGATVKQEKLDSELKNYKHNMIKESIRVCVLVVSVSLLPSRFSFISLLLDGPQ